MGTYGLNEEEIEIKILEALDNAEGDMDSYQLKRVFEKIAKEYPHTLDRWTCQKCKKMFQLYKTEKSLSTGVYSFICTHCGKDNK